MYLRYGVKTYDWWGSKGIAGKPLINTGAESSVLSTKSTKKLGVSIQLSKIYSKAKTKFCINGKCSKANFIITNNEGTDMILGIDWIKENKAVIYTKSGTLHWSDDYIDVYYDALEPPKENQIAIEKAQE